MPFQLYCNNYEIAMDKLALEIRCCGYGVETNVVGLVRDVTGAYGLFLVVCAPASPAIVAGVRSVFIYRMLRRALFPVLVLHGRLRA